MKDIEVRFCSHCGQSVCQELDTPTVEPKSVLGSYAIAAIIGAIAAFILIGTENNPIPPINNQSEQVQHAQ